MMEENVGAESFRDTDSVASSSVAGFPPSSSSRHGAMSPVLSHGGASVLSSPRAGFASAADDNTVVRQRVPRLPTGKSWADVARREKRRV
jgi:hypothetical protein